MNIMQKIKQNLCLFALIFILSISFSNFAYAQAYTKLFDLNGGRDVHSTNYLTFGSDGKLYGLISRGGSHNLGTIFSYDPTPGVTTPYVDLHDFDSLATGTVPNGSLTLDSDGKLYGLTSAGGANGNGIIFSYNPGAVTPYSYLSDLPSQMRFSDGSLSTETTLYSYGSLTFGSDGKLYGITYRGLVYSYDLTLGTYTALANIAEDFFGSLTLGSDGKFYGLGHYKIFSCDTAAISCSVLYSLSLPGGDSLTFGSDGKLYGKYSDSSNGVFSYDLSSSIFTQILSARGGLHGSFILGSNGKFYYTITNSGSNDKIVVYDPAPGATTPYKVLYNFIIGSIDGSWPLGTLALSSAGKLYGMTAAGGANGLGVIFSYNLIPDAPISPIATLGSAQISVSWTAPNSNGTAISEYRVYNASNNSLVATSATTSAVVTISSTGTYSYYITAVNSGGESDHSVNTTPLTITISEVLPGGSISSPDAPVSPIATPGAAQISLSWTTPSDGGTAITKYGIYDASNGSLVKTATETKTIITNLINGTSYSYYITAFNWAGESSHSIIVSAIPNASIVPVVSKSCPKGDANGDCRVDILDFNILMVNWEKKGINIADFDESGLVDILDFNILMVNWSK
jgi:uncharacterized repeat protein (TIGR03803 family)